MKVALLISNPAVGGQRLKAGRYVEHLAAAGVEASLKSPGEAIEGRYDIVHLFNLDWPVVTAMQYRSVRRRCDRIVLSTIHHRESWMRELHRHARRGVAGVIARRVPLARFEALRGLAVSARSPGQLPEALRQFVTGTRAAQARLLDSVDLSLVLAEGELASLTQDFGFDGPVAEVRNGASTAHASPPPGLPDEFLLTVGRIEARKNQQLLLRVAVEMDLPVVLVGPSNPRHKAISRSIAASTRASTGVIWLQSLPRDQMLGLYRHAAAHVLPSWCEVVPQVDLEAALGGTRVVTTTRGHTDEYLGPAAVYWDPASGADGLRDSIVEVLSRQKPEPRPPDDFGWGPVGRGLLKAYEKALELR